MKFVQHLVNLLRTGSETQPITDPREVASTYKYWRIRVFYSMYLGYAMFYLTRKNLNFIMPTLMSDLHFTKIDLGLLGTAFYIMYGVSKFVSGMLSDRSNPQYFMAFGLIATGIANIAFAMSSCLWLLLVSWVVNAFFQGWGWPPCARYLRHWYSQRERGRWWGVWNTSHNVGGGLIPIVAGVLATYWGWRSAMYVPGIIVIGMGIFLINRLRDVPETMGLPPIEVYRNDIPDDTHAQYGKTSMKEMLIKHVIKNKYIWILSLAYVLLYLVRTAVNDWASLLLTERGNSLIRANSIVTFFEVGGFFGSIFAGWSSDKLFAGRRGPVNCLFSIGILVSVIAFWLTPGDSVVLNSAVLFAIGFLVFGPQMLIGVAVSELSHREAAGTSTGFLGLFAYLGAAVSGLPIGYIMQHYNWKGFFVTIVASALLTILMLAMVWNTKGKKAATTV